MELELTSHGDDGVAPRTRSFSGPLLGLYDNLMSVFAAVMLSELVNKNLTPIADSHPESTFLLPAMHL